MLKQAGLNRRHLLQAGLGAGGLAAGFGGGIGISFAETTGTGKTKVNIVEGASTVQMTMGELMRRQGYFTEFDLDASLNHITDGSRLMASLISGDQDLCVISGFGQIFPAVERGAKMKIIAGANTVVGMVVYTSRADIKSLKDLEGRSVGIGSPGSLLHQIMVAAMAKENLDYNKVQFVNIGSNADVFRAVAAGTVDAGPSTTDTFYEQAQYGVHSIAEMWKLIPEYPYQGSYAADTVLKNKRDAVVRVLAAYGKLYRFMMTPESKQPWIDAYVAVASPKKKQAEDLWRFNFESQSYDVNLTVPDKSLEYLQNLNIQLGVQKKRLPLSDVRDMSLAGDAVKLMGGPVTPRPATM